VLPLASLRAFEAASRHGSFAAAADELHVTAAAISHRIKDLEGRLGVALFERKPRGVVPTEAGRRYHEQIAAALQMIERATAQIDVNAVDGPLTVSTPRSFADHWLVTRLADLKDTLPGLALTLVADSALADLRDGQADVGLRFGQGQYPGLHSEYLCSDAVTVLAPAERVQQSANANTPALLQREVLLADVSALPGEPWSHWQPWVRESGLPHPHLLRYMHFSDSGLAVRAAAAGTGLCIGRLSVVHDLLERRKLRALLPWRTTDFAYYLVCRDAEKDSPRINAFRDWLKAAVAEYATIARDRYSVSLLTGAQG
jgi:LysR family transcriptional regulator, glycine cleavage system transcriptional activator